MEGSLAHLFVATAAFVCGHFLLSSRPVRRPIINAVGDGPFRGLYAVLALAAFAWTLWAYGRAPHVEFWSQPAWAYTLPLVLMPIAAILLVAGVSTRSVTAVGGEALADSPDPAPGIFRVSRHPFLCATTLWAVTHIVANGDGANLILMVGILVLSLGGMAHIDARRRAALGSAWGPIALTTSVMPFAAILAGRTKFDWAGIGWQRLLGGLALYLALLFAHEWLIGVSPVPA